MSDNTLNHVEGQDRVTRLIYWMRSQYPPRTFCSVAADLGVSAQSVSAMLRKSVRAVSNKADGNGDPVRPCGRSRTGLRQGEEKLCCEKCGWFSLRYSVDVIVCCFIRQSACYVWVSAAARLCSDPLRFVDAAWLSGFPSLRVTEIRLPQ